MTRDGGPLRVLSVLPSMARNTGGPAINLAQATLALPPTIQRTFLCTDSGGPAATKPFVRIRPDQLPNGAGGLDLHLFPTRRPYQFNFSPALYRAIARRIDSVDLVTIHSLNLFPQLAAFLNARRARTPYIVTPHGALDPWLRSSSARIKAVNNRLWQDRMLDSASALHFTAQREADLAADVAPHVPRVIVPNGVDLARFADLPDGGSFRRRHLGGHTGPLVLFHSRIARKKGIDVLIRAFANTPEATAARLAIVGPDDEALTSELERVAREAGVAERVHFIGPLYGDDLLESLSAADVWALTSHTENFGNAVLEALAAGLPAIVSTEVNIAGDIAAADAGLVTPQDARVVAASLGRLLSDPGLRAHLSSRAREFATRYDWSRVGPELAQMYLTVAGAR